MWCYHCEQHLTKDKFYKDKSRKTGCTSRCKVCDLAIKKKGYVKKPKGKRRNAKVNFGGCTRCGVPKETNKIIHYTTPNAKRNVCVPCYIRLKGKMLMHRRRMSELAVERAESKKEMNEIMYPHTGSEAMLTESDLRMLL